MKPYFTTRTMLAAACLVGVLPCARLQALVLDSFVEGPFDFSGVKILQNTSITSPLGITFRDLYIGPRTTPAADRLLAKLIANQGVLVFDSSDTTPGTPYQNLNIDISYRTDTSFDASTYSAFGFDFTDLVGTGDLVIEIGFGPSIYRENTLSTPITEPGWLAVPMEAINYSTSGGDTLNAFKSIHFTFRATSPTFGFTLNEIALATVPEPASAAALLGAAAGVLTLLHRHPRRPAG